MTSQRSSVNTFSKTFWYTVKNSLYVPAIVASVLVIGVAYLASYLSSSETVYDVSYIEEKAATVSRDVKFILLGTGYGLEETLFALHFVFALAAVMLAVIIFRFINSKKTVNVWFGLGISKAKLFYSKLLGGVFLLGAMIFLPSVLDLLVNVRLFGFSYELFMSWLYITVGFIVYTLNIFLLFTAVMCFVGTNVEGVVFGGILLFTPSLVYYEISVLMNKLTLGSELSNYSESLTLKLKYYNPIMFLSDSSAFSSLMKSGEYASFVWNTPPFFSVILWLCVTAVLAVAAGALFKRRKTEIAGFWGSSKVMTFIISLDAGLSAFCVGVASIKNERAASILIGLIAAVAIFLVADILLTLNKKEWVKNLKMLPVQTAILAAVGTVFATGLFGYSSRIPELKRVKEIAITPVAYNGFANMADEHYLIDEYPGSPPHDYYYSTPMLYLLTDNDKRLATEIHRHFIEADLIEPDVVGSESPRAEQILYNPVMLEYTMKDGSKLKRCYNYVPMSIFKAYEELNYGDWYKESVITNMTEPVSKSDSEQIKSRKSFFQQDDNAIYLASKHLDESYSRLSLTTEQRKQLLKAVANDLISSGADVKQKPLTEQLATLVFTRDSIKAMDAKNEAADENIYYETNDGYYDYKNDISPYYSQTTPNPYQTAPQEGVWRYFADNTMMSVMITEQMTETLAFLEENGFSELLSFDIDIVSARVLSRSALAKADDETPIYPVEVYPEGIQFNGMFTYELPVGSFKDTEKITDVAAIEKLQKYSYSSYYTDEEVYYVCYGLADGDYSIMCIPAKLMPEELVP